MKRSRDLLDLAFFIALASLILIPIAASGQNQEGSAGRTGFIENKGQIHDQHRKPNHAVQYLLNQAGMNVQLRADGFSYDTYRTEEHSAAMEQQANGDLSMARDAPTAETYRFHRIDLRFVNGNTNPDLIAGDESLDHLNYYTDVTGEAGATFLYHYATVTYMEVWPNIDVRCAATEEGFKYDVIVRPGGDVNDVRFNVQGATISESLKGRLVFTWAEGSFEESIPDSWMENGRKRSRVSVRYVLHGDGTFAFAAEGVATGTLVIDPYPANPWATYCGGTGNDESRSVAMDGSGNIFMGGSTSSTTVIATTGAHDVTYAGSNDAFLVKYDPSGTKLWGTYCGGSGAETLYGVDATTAGVAAICGSTSSNSGIATAGTHQTTFSGGTSDAFIVRFQTNGTRIWGSYLGGALEDGAYGISVSDNGKSVICGHTASTSGIASASAADATYGGNTDAFVAQFTSTGAREWGTYLGGTGGDVAAAVDYTGSNPLVCGHTSSTSGIATANSHDPTYNGQWDAFVTRYHANGAKLLGTYFGGPDDEFARSTTFNALNRAVVVGNTSSTVAIASSGAAQPIYGGGSSDGFIACFDLPTLTRVWSTYCGGSGSGLGFGMERLMGVARTSGGGVAVVGYPFSTGFGTPDSWSPTGTDPDGPRPTMVAGYSSSGGKQWAGYPEFLKGQAVAGNASSVVVSGNGIQTNPLITPPNAYQPGWGGGVTEAFLCKLDLSEGSAIAPQQEAQGPSTLKWFWEDGSLRVSDPLSQAPGTLMIHDALGRRILTSPWQHDVPVRLPAYASGTYTATLVRSDSSTTSARFTVY